MAMGLIHIALALFERALLRLLIDDLWGPAWGEFSFQVEQGFLIR
jgi:hypothetical protein